MDELQSLQLSMQVEEERADAAAMRIEKKLRRLQVAKQGDDNDLAEAKRWLECITYGMNYAGAADAAERSTKAREMIQIISRSLLCRCAQREESKASCSGGGL